MNGSYVTVMNKSAGDFITVSGDSLKLLPKSGHNLVNQTFLLTSSRDTNGITAYYLENNNKEVVTNRLRFEIEEKSVNQSNLFHANLVNKNNKKDVFISKPISVVNFIQRLLGKNKNDTLPVDLSIWWTAQNEIIYLDTSFATGKNPNLQIWEISPSECIPLNWKETKQGVQKMATGKKANIQDHLHYYISPSNSYDVISFEANNSKSYNNLILNEKSKTLKANSTLTTQQFQIKSQSNGTYSIINSANKKALESDQCLNIGISTESSSMGQQFIIEKGLLNKEMFRIRSANSNHYLTKNTIQKDNQYFELNSPDTSINQEFKLTKEFQSAEKTLALNEKSDDPISIAGSFVNSFSIGSSNNAVLKLNDKTFLSYNIDKEITNPWINVSPTSELQFTKFSAGGSDLIWALTADFQLYFRDTVSKIWQNSNINFSLKSISAGDNGSIWGTTLDGSIYRMSEDKMWIPLPDQNNLFQELQAISNTEAYGLTMTGYLMKWSEESQIWERISKNPSAPSSLKSLTASSIHNIWAITNSGELTYFSYKDSIWLKPTATKISLEDKVFTLVSAGVDGFTWAIDDCYTIWQINQVDGTSGSWYRFIQTGKSQYSEVAMYLNPEFTGLGKQAAENGGNTIDNFTNKISNFANSIDRSKNNDQERDDFTSSVLVPVLISSVEAGIGTGAALATFGSAAAIGGFILGAGVVNVIALPLLFSSEKYDVEILIINNTDTRLELANDIYIKHGKYLTNSNNILAPRNEFGPSVSMYRFSKKSFEFYGVGGIIRFTDDYCSDFPGLAVGFNAPYRDKAAIQHKNRVYVGLDPIGDNDKIYDAHFSKNLGKAIITSSSSKENYNVYAAINDADTKFPIIVVYLEEQ